MRPAVGRTLQNNGSGVFLHSRDYHAGEGQQRDRVGDDHQLVEHIGQLPHEVVGGQGAQEDEYEGDELINADRLLAEEVDDVDLAEHVPAKDGGEGEEEQAAIAVASAWKELIPLSCFLPLRVMFPKTRFIPSPKKRIWTKPVLMVYQRPTRISRKTST